MSGEDQPILSPTDRRAQRRQALGQTDSAPPSADLAAGAQRIGETMISATDLVGDQTGRNVGDRAPGIPKETPEDLAAMQAARADTTPGLTADAALGLEPPKLDDTVGANDPRAPQDDAAAMDALFTRLRRGQGGNQPPASDTPAAQDARQAPPANTGATFAYVDSEGQMVGGAPPPPPEQVAEVDRPLPIPEVIPTGEIKDNPFHLNIAGLTVASEEHPERNEDAAFISAENGIVIIGDGMSRPLGGEIASNTGVQKIRDELMAKAPFTDTNEAVKAIVQAVKDANEAILIAVKNGPQIPNGDGTTRAQYEKIGTTMTIGCFVNLPSGKRELVIGNNGDSRAYRHRNGELSQLTLDDSYMNMVIQATTPKGEDWQVSARNFQAKLNNATDESELTEQERFYFGKRSTVHNIVGRGGVPNIIIEDVLPGDRLFFCSDSAPDNKTDTQLATLLDPSTQPMQAAQRVVKETVKQGRPDVNGNTAFRNKQDDCTVVIVDALPVPERKRSPEEETRDAINRMAEQLNGYLHNEPLRRQMQDQMNAAVGAIYAGSRVIEFGTNTQTGPYMYTRYVRDGQMLPEEFNTFAARTGECEISPDGVLATPDVLRFLVLGSGLQRSIAEVSANLDTRIPQQFANILEQYMRLENAHSVITKFIERHKDEFTQFLQKYAQK